MGFLLGLALTRSPLQAAPIGAIAFAANWAGAVVNRRRASPAGNRAPYLGQPSNHNRRDPTSKPQVAIFWDYENVRMATRGTSAPLAEQLVAYAKSLGHPCLKIVYANWSGQRSGQARRRGEFAGRGETVVKALYSLGFEPIYVSMGKANSADVKLAVDCLRAVYRQPSLTHIIIVTGDKDFIPLVNALKDLEKTVTIIGHADKVSEHLELSADAFISVSELLNRHPISADSESLMLEPSEDSAENDAGLMTYNDAVNCLVNTIASVAEQGKSARIETIGRLMRTVNPKYMGATQVVTPCHRGTFTKFSAFIATAVNEGQIRLETAEDGSKQLFLPDENQSRGSSSKALQTINQSQWTAFISEVRSILSEKGSLSFVPLLCLLSKSKQMGKLGSLSHSSLRRALQQLVEIQLLVREDETLFRFQDDSVLRVEDALEKLMDDNVSWRTST
ncbi:MAG: NYN domain-containing protein [Cyanobacteria bacterium P01_F01_bin.42]